MARISNKQSEIYDFIVKFTKSHGYPPSVREIGEAVELRSPSTVHTHLNKLRESGLITKDARKTRAISIPGSSGIPIVNKISAGVPPVLGQECGRLPYFPQQPGDYFAYQICGVSMSGAGILEGDYVVACKQAAIKDGDIVIALTEGNLVIRRLIVTECETMLEDMNTGCINQLDSKHTVAGKVAAVIRQYNYDNKQ